MNEFDLKETLGNNKTLVKHIKLLSKLSNDRVMCVGHTQNGSFYIMECCDEYFSHELNKEECMELSDLFKEIAESIDK